MKIMRILSISLGTRDCGVAVLSHGQLIHWKTHSFHERWSDEKLEAMMLRFDRYITRYRVQYVVIKIPPATHHSNSFLRLLKRLSYHVQVRGCVVVCKTKAKIKKFVPEVTNTETLMEYVTRHYPILLPEQAQELLGRQPYHLKMFEAVLAAHVYKEHLSS